MDLLDRMETYVRVVEAGSLSAAARARGLSVAAVSRQLSATEAELNTRLIVRTTRRLQVTEPGMRWYHHCTRILDQLRIAASTPSPTRSTGRSSSRRSIRRAG